MSRGHRDGRTQDVRRWLPRVLEGAGPFRCDDCKVEVFLRILQILVRGRAEWAPGKSRPLSEENDTTSGLGID